VRVPSILRVGRTMGPRWVLARGYYELCSRAGAHRLRFPRGPWPRVSVKAAFQDNPDALQRSVAARLQRVRWGRANRADYRAFRSGRLPQLEDARLTRAADRIADNAFPYFSREWIDHRTDVRWEWNPQAGVDWTGLYGHWSTISAWAHHLVDGVRSWALLWLELWFRTFVDNSTVPVRLELMAAGTPSPSVARNR
jgi:hypothetical protein